MTFSPNPFDMTGTLETSGYGLKSMTSDLSGALTVTAATNVGALVTATVGSTGRLYVGEPVIISGITGFTTNNPNGAVVVNSIPSGTTFTYVSGSTATGSYVSGGAVRSGADPGNTSAASVCTAFDDATLTADAANRVLLGQPLSPSDPWH